MDKFSSPTDTDRHLSDQTGSRPSSRWASFSFLADPLHQGDVYSARWLTTWFPGCTRRTLVQVWTQSHARWFTVQWRLPLLFLLINSISLPYPPSMGGRQVDITREGGGPLERMMGGRSLSKEVEWDISSWQALDSFLLARPLPLIGCHTSSSGLKPLTVEPPKTSVWPSPSNVHFSFLTSSFKCILGPTSIVHFSGQMGRYLTVSWAALYLSRNTREGGARRVLPQWRRRRSDLGPKKKLNCHLELSRFVKEGKFVIWYWAQNSCSSQIHAVRELCVVRKYLLWQSNKCARREIVFDKLGKYKGNTILKEDARKIPLIKTPKHLLITLLCK